MPTAKLNLSKVRGRDAFYIEDHDSYLEIVAELVRGAQVGRQDRIVFTRKCVLHKSPMVHYRANLLVTGSGSNSHKFYDMILNSNLEDEGTTVNNIGVLRVRIPVDQHALEGWTKARTGTTYTVHSIMLGSDYLADLCLSRWNAEGATTMPKWAMA